MRKFLIPQPSERMIRENILHVLNLAGYYVWTNNVGGMNLRYTDRQGTTRERRVRFGKAGMSDIIGIQPKTGVFIAIEVKTPKTKTHVTQWQQDFIDEVNRMGGIGFVAWNEDIVKEKLKLRMTL